MQKKTLANGMEVIWQPKPSDAVVIQAFVKVGSNYETKNILGAAHFVEHMLFETKKRSAKQLAFEIESLGGIINAFTEKEFTAVYVYIAKKYFERGLDVIADVIKNAAFKEEMFKIEKSIILNEIKFWYDDPKERKWDLFFQALFPKHPTGNPVIGTRKTVKAITRNVLYNFYKKYYSPKNMSIAVLGNVKNVFKKVEDAFSDFDRKFYKKEIKKAELLNKHTVKKEKRNIEHAHIVLGYAIPTRESKESYAFDIMANILGYGLSSWLTDEIRQKRGLAYHVAAETQYGKQYGTFSVELSTNKEHVKECLKIILEQFNRLQKLTKKQLNDAKKSVIGLHAIKKDNSIQHATLLNYWNYIKDARFAEKYPEFIKAVKLEDVKRLAKEFLNENYSIAIITP